MNQFGRFFLAELLVIATAVAVFRFVPERLMAGAIAGAFFVAIGMWIFIAGLRDSRLRRRPTFIANLAHLFLSALPLMLTRLANQAAGFQDVRVLGLPGPVFHQVSTAIYFTLLAATLWDWFREKRAMRREAGSRA